jgi:hypothetical protein
MTATTKRSLVPIMVLAIAGTALMAGCSDVDQHLIEQLGQEKPEAMASGSAAAATESAAPTGTAAATETAAATGTAAPTAAPSKAGGTLYETEMFSILVPDGWKTADLSYEEEYLSDVVAVMITKGEDVMQVAMDTDPYVSNPNDYTSAYPDADAWSKEYAENTMEQNGGTALEEVTMLDMGFFTTSVTADGKDQTVFVGARDGRVVRIVMAGKDNQENPELKAMLESITFK